MSFNLGLRQCWVTVGPPERNCDPGAFSAHRKWISFPSFFPVILPSQIYVWVCRHKYEDTHICAKTTCADAFRDTETKLFKRTVLEHKIWIWGFSITSPGSVIYRRTVAQTAGTQIETKMSQC